MKAGMSAPGTKPTKSLVVLMSASDPKRTSSRIHPDRNWDLYTCEPYPEFFGLCGNSATNCCAPCDCLAVVSGYRNALNSA